MKEKMIVDGHKMFKNLMCILKESNDLTLKERTDQIKATLKKCDYITFLAVGKAMGDLVEDCK